MSHILRIQIAANPATPCDELAALTQDASPDVVAAACANPSTPEEALVEPRFVGHERYEHIVLAGLAQNPRLDPERLCALLHHDCDHDSVAKYAAANPSLPIDALKEALFDERLSTVVRDRIAMNKAMPLQFLFDNFGKLSRAAKAWAARQPGVTAKHFTLLKRDHPHFANVAEYAEGERLFIGQVIRDGGSVGEARKAWQTSGHLGRLYSYEVAFDATGGKLYWKRPTAQEEAEESLRLQAENEKWEAGRLS